ncbi:hypothetical protein [Vitiosangium sp. GDMCC 1.1324]|uniref:hypothetical protein n=1 Tax=Vitiosangium sp. (strain GDMCC 1.1324) TaxID=2138576 RepID=UPI000D3A076F|nr:hypothetical protein [Vitiosangium sp. GDMCC 1.1324]PTL79105.1 hypothetical protein DAT35_36465 [Vitiosangium sp. GDMCC 1.1324]
MKRALPLLLSLSLLTSTAAVAALGPDTPMPGLNSEVWGRICSRSDAITKTIARVNPGLTPQDLSCITAWLQLTMFRRVQVLGALGGAGPLLVHMAGKDGMHTLETAEPAAREPERAPLVTDEAEARGGAMDKLRDNHTEQCRGGGGSGGSGSAGVDHLALVEKWKANHADWDTSPAYGPSLFPDAKVLSRARSAITAPSFRAKTAAAFPALNLGAIIERLASGRLSGQDVEQLRLALGLAGANLVLNAKGVITTAPARAIPIWFVPPEVLPDPMRKTNQEQGL